jgi:hypothetical protein
LTDDDRIPIVETYRGVGIHNEQSRQRVASVVKPSVDRVHEEDNPDRLLEIARNVQEPPEARLFAAAKIEAAFELAADERRVRPNVDLTVLKATVAGLNSQGWRDPARFCSLFDGPGAVERPKDARF